VAEMDAAGEDVLMHVRLGTVGGWVVRTTTCGVHRRVRERFAGLASGTGRPGGRGRERHRAVGELGSSVLRGVPWLWEATSGRPGFYYPLYVACVESHPGLHPGRAHRAAQAVG